MKKFSSILYLLVIAILIFVCVYTMVDIKSVGSFISNENDSALFKIVALCIGTLPSIILANRSINLMNREVKIGLASAGLMFSLVYSLVVLLALFINNFSTVGTYLLQFIIFLTALTFINDTNSFNTVTSKFQLFAEIVCGVTTVLGIYLSITLQASLSTLLYNSLSDKLLLYYLMLLIISFISILGVPFVDALFGMPPREETDVSSIVNSYSTNNPITPTFEDTKVKQQVTRVVESKPIEQEVQVQNSTIPMYTEPVKNTMNQSNQNTVSPIPPQDIINTNNTQN